MTVCFGSTLDHKHVTGSNRSMSLFSNQTGTSRQFLLPRRTGGESIRGVPYAFYGEKMISHGFTAIKTTTGLLSLALTLEKMERQRYIDAASSSQPENQLDGISRATSAPFTSCATYKHEKQAQHTSLLLLRAVIRLCLLFKRLQVNNNSINPHKSPPPL